MANRIGYIEYKGNFVRNIMNPVEIEINLVHKDWIGEKGLPVSQEKKFELEMGNFHAGTVFKGKIILSVDDLCQLCDSWVKDGCRPVMEVCIY